MPTLINLSARVLHLPRLDPTKEIVARSKLTKDEESTLSGTDDSGNATAFAPWGPAILGPPPPPADYDDSAHPIPRFPNRIEISVGHLKVLQHTYKASFGSMLDAGLKVSA